ncbi:polyketide synthase [Collybiopsis luxurians FD-317 M1]|uniref:Pks2 protein n=1 Tax=Collybiopsis luxurians FD-317 M1 TaxID=944289 RepID=A0A0D0C4S6_9AGAR|nr:polyketide synthase [Collybiopsis luxurians FD-317 M1]
MHHFGSSGQLHVPIFSGQGSSLSTLSAYTDCINPDSRHGSTLLTMCHEAFIEELSTLSALELSQVDVDPQDFRSPETLLSMWLLRFFHNPVMSSSTLVLVQLLRYLSFVERFGLESGSLTPFSDLLSNHSASRVGVLGFSSGILPACVVAASYSTASYLSFAVEVYRLALWIGIRCQLYRRSTSDAETALPWSLVLLGTSQEAAQEAIENFTEQRSHRADPSGLYITAVMDDSCVTVSGSPTLLAEIFAKVTTIFGPSVVAHSTSVDTLYHCPLVLKSTREQVLSDVVRRDIRFPDLSDLLAPVRSTSNGILLDRSAPNDGSSLLLLVIDMLLVQPVRWDLVASEVAKSFPDGDLKFLNFGPGVALSRGLERACPKGRVHLHDLSTNSENIPKSQPKQDAIAVVGMAVNMPGSPNVSKLWEILEQGINTLSEIPERCFNIRDYDGTKNPNRYMKARTGNFIETPGGFDNRFFKISPREAKCMDPQQRILLHTAYEALEDAGYVPGDTLTSQPEMVGCYIGVATHDYIQNLHDHIDVYYSTGTLKAFLSGRISYAMGFSGPSVVIETACSSSLVAIYQGARALMNRDCDSALVGGVNVISSPDMFLGLDRGHFLSPTGSCKAFDAKADGYSRGEGCGMFVIKRLSDAIAENDHIYGVIRGIEVNQSGLAQSITHPHAPTQMALFRQVLRNSGITASRVNVVEAHGTGTQAGDVNELASIRNVFTSDRSSWNPLHITSVKGNLGHLEAASGAASLAKLLLMLKHRLIPPQISFSQLNPLIEPLEKDNTVISQALIPWKPSHEGYSRVAFLNNYGASGSNAALILEEEIQPTPPAFSHPLVFTMSAKDEFALQALRSKYIEWLLSRDSKDIPLSHIAYSMTARRQIYSYRLAVVASERTQLLENLRKATVVSSSTRPNPKVVFVFSGQGGQYLGMGSALYGISPMFRQHIDECNSILISMGFSGIVSVIKGDPASRTRPAEIEIYQTAIFSLEYALARLWISWGLQPSALIGHSLGEYAALVLAGVLNLKGALKLVAHRARLMLQKCTIDSTGMLAVNLSPETVEDLLGSSAAYNSLVISCYNSPDDCVVSGPVATLQEFKAFLDASIGCRSKMLVVPYGYHCDAMLPIADDLTSTAAEVDIQSPIVPIASNVYGRIVFPGEEGLFTPEYFARHCVEPVRFHNGVCGIIDAFSAASGIWLEIGPHPTCLPMLKAYRSLSGGATLLASLKQNHSPWMTVGCSLASLFGFDIPLKWRETFAHVSGVRCTSLPSYPFSKTNYWISYKEDRSSLTEPQTTGPISEYFLLSRWEQYPCVENDFIAVFETPISRLSELILGHKVGELPLCPASVFIELVYGGVELSVRQRDMSARESVIQISAIDFVKGLVFKDDVSRSVLTKISFEDGCGSFSVYSRVDPSPELILHVRGKYRLQPIPGCTARFTQKFSSLTGKIDRIKDPNSKAELFQSRTVYEVVFPRVVSYAVDYQSIQSLSVITDELEGFASIRLPQNRCESTFVAHPVLLDSLLQVPGFIANMQGNVGDAFICCEITSIEVITTSLDNNATYSVYCKGVWCDSRNSLSFEVSAIKDGDSPQIVAFLKGVTFRQMPLESLRRGLVIAAISGSRQISRPRPPPIALPLPGRGRSNSSPPNFTNVAGELHLRIFAVIAETCDVERHHVTAATPLDALGIDSLMLIELSAKLHSIIPRADLQLRSLYSCKTVADILRLSSSIFGLEEPLVSPTITSVESAVSTPATLVADDSMSEFFIESTPDVKRIVSFVLDVPTEAIGDQDVLESFGLDSLAAMEVLQVLKAQSGLQLPNNLLDDHTTVAAIQEYLNERLKRSESTDVILQSPRHEAVQARLIRILRLGTNPTLVQEGSDRNIPIFFIHDGSGLVNYYERVRSLNRCVWAVYNPRFLNAEPWKDVHEMASAYTDYIVSLAAGPILLGGWSFGGVVAYEISLQLAKRNVEVKGVVLIDSPNPVGHTPLPNTLIKSVARYDRKTGPVEIGRLVQTQFTMNANLLGSYDPFTTGGDCPPLAFLRSSTGYNEKSIAEIPSWLADRSDPGTAIEGWAVLSKNPIKMWDIPGHHFQAFDNNNIDSVSSKLLDACEYLENL